MQWWLLLVAAAPIGVWLTVRDARLERERLRGGAALTQDEAAQDAPQKQPVRTVRTVREPRRQTKRARPSDEEIEDGL